MTDETSTPAPDPTPGVPDGDGPPLRTSGFEPPSVRLHHEERAKKTILLVLRSAFLVSLITVTLLVVLSKANTPETSAAQAISFGTIVGLFVGITAFGVLVLIVDALTPNKRLSAVVGVYFGLVAGLVASIAIGALLDVVAEAWELNQGQNDIYIGLIKVTVAITLCYLAISLVMTTKDSFRLVIPYVEIARQVRGIRPLLLDTSALIDGRVENLGNTGFLDAPLIVPEFVIEELQALSDSNDKLKRSRGRRGLTVLGRLQQDPQLDLSLDGSDAQSRSVDHALIKLAEDQNLRILTTDYNLNKVAQIRGVAVLNVNDLASTMKSQAVPGETLEVELVKPGESANQGVGYMPDGTMVVVEDGDSHIGETILIVVTNSLQTSAGRMIFGRPSTEEPTSTEALADAATNQPRSTDRPTSRRRSTTRNPRR